MSEVVPPASSHPAIKSMMRTLNRGLGIVLSSEDSEPIERHKILKRLTLTETARHTFALLDFASKDLATVAFSAYNMATESGLSSPATVTRNSTELLGFAALEDVEERKFLKSFCTYPAFGMQVFNPYHLAIEDKPLQIRFSASIEREIEERQHTTPTAGCPAIGTILNATYERYIDVIFAAQLADELATSNTA